MIKITLPYNIRIDQALMPTTGIVMELPDNVDATTTYSRDGTLTIIFNDGCDCEPDDDCRISDGVRLNDRTSVGGRIETRTAIAPVMGGKIG